MKGDYWYQDLAVCLVTPRRERCAKGFMAWLAEELVSDSGCKIPSLFTKLQLLHLAILVRQLWPLGSSMILSTTQSKTQIRSLCISETCRWEKVFPSPHVIFTLGVTLFTIIFMLGSITQAIHYKPGLPISEILLVPFSRRQTLAQ